MDKVAFRNICYLNRHVLEYKASEKMAYFVGASVTGTGAATAHFILENPAGNTRVAHIRSIVVYASFSTSFSIVKDGTTEGGTADKIPANMDIEEATNDGSGDHETSLTFKTGEDKLTGGDILDYVRTLDGIYPVAITSEEICLILNPGQKMTIGVIVALGKVAEVSMSWWEEDRSVG